MDESFDIMVARMEESLTRTAAREYWNAKLRVDVDNATPQKAYIAENALTPPGFQTLQNTCRQLSGSFRIHSAKCTGQYLSFDTNCESNVIRLRSMNRVTGSVSDWMLDAPISTFANVRANRSCSATILTSGNQPALSRSTTLWTYKFIPAGSCSSFNMMANSSTGAGRYLSVKSDCTGFEWRVNPDTSGATWNISKLHFFFSILHVHLLFPCFGIVNNTYLSMHIQLTKTLGSAYLSAAESPNSFGTPSAPLPPPPPLSCPNLKGSFRIQPVKCGNLYLSFATKCDDRVVRLRTLQQATGSRTLWMLDTATNVFANVRSNRSCSANILSSGNQPSFGTSATQWMYRLDVAGSCSVYNMLAKSSTGAGKYLSVKSDCTGFEWRVNPDTIGSKWNMSKYEVHGMPRGTCLPSAAKIASLFFFLPLHLLLAARVALTSFAVCFNAVQHPPSPPPPPPAITCSRFKGTYRMQSSQCRGQYLSFANKCDDRVVRLRTLQQATGSRTLWMLDTATNVFANVRSNRSCSANILSSGNQPSFGTSATQWMYKIIPAGSCATFTLMAKSSTGAGKYLGVKSDCSGFFWRADPGGSTAQWQICKCTVKRIKAKFD
jgi:hypothetical protein